ncbi:NmrA-like family protein [Macrophomina phaseolina MS6]|uniref:NmrA-like family protein n=1 Tax=Macrophomina phaseolina (strain MS6) TaxID=1126212 RepID=K2RTW4_MACPH|nr:NmrA-like family protein [Macrophomina phaseolina MS6]
MTSTIKPLYMFTGAIAEYYFRRSPLNWDSETKTFNFHGPISFPTRYTTANDIANYVLEAITAPDAAAGGYLRVQSFEASPDDIAKAYSAARGGRAQITLNCLGTLEDAKARLDDGRAKYAKRDWHNYAFYVYEYHIPSRSWDYEPVDSARFSNVKRTSLEQFFLENPDI